MNPLWPAAEILFDLSIPLRFGGPQPNAYGVEPAVAEAVKSGSLIGDTRKGGSCNFERYTFIPHCSGTHTECVGHITHKRITVRECLRDIIVQSLLVSVVPELENGDRLITEQSLKVAIRNQEEALDGDLGSPSALIVRTLPNNEGKLTRIYDEAHLPPYFSLDAMRFIAGEGFKHLLVDLPSIDRLYDGGRLLNHRIFWNVAEGSFETSAETRLNSTITEMIFVPNEAADGAYTLNFQIAPFDSDCAPSRPILTLINT